MGATASFVYDEWNACYREFSNVSEVQAKSFWVEATLIHRNDGGGPVQDANQQAILLYMLTAHIAYLRVGTADNPSPASQGIVGRVSSVTQGSVSLSSDLLPMPGTASYYALSVYGLSYWNATAPFRTFHYRRGYGRRFPW